MSTDEGREDSFGFESLRSSARERIRDIKPAVPVGFTEDMSRVDAVADSAGFVSREAPEFQHNGTRNRRPEPRSALNMRVPVTLGNAFQRFCEENRYSYPEGLEEIMKRAGLSPK